MLAALANPTIAVVALWLAASMALAAPAWRQDFESDSPSWQAAGADCRYRVDPHARVAEAHSGAKSEFLAVHAEPGTAVYFCHDVERPQIIDELRASLWVRSDRGGIQLLAHVVLPRTLDRRTGKPLFTLLPGGSYAGGGGWQQLVLADLPLQLERQVRLLRLELGPHVDEREAYIERLVLNTYGGPGTTRLWIDDLEIEGHVSRRAVPLATPEAVAIAQPMTGPANRPAGGPMPAAAASTLRVELSGSTLLVDGRPLAPRLIEHRGEPLTTLKQLGFHGVWLRQLASSELLAEAARLGLWVVCPPPRPGDLDSPYGATAQLAEFGPQYERVLAWEMGETPGANIESVRRWAEQVRLAGRSQSRPIVGRPLGESRAYSRVFDLLWTGRSIVGTTMPWNDYREWLAAQPLLVRPGSTFWATVQTQLPPIVGEQWTAIAADRAPSLDLPVEQIRLLAHTSIAAGCRGLLFLSHAPLSLEGPERSRAMALELVNRELSLVEPWMAAGVGVGEAETSVVGVHGAILRSDRARLLLPCWTAAGAQFVTGHSAANALVATLPGVPETSSAFDLVPGGMRPLRHKRVVGGLQVTIDEFGVAGPVLLAHDPSIIAAMGRDTVSAGPRSAELLRNLATERLAVDARVAAELPRLAPAKSAEWLAAARQSIEWCDGQLAAKQFQAAWLTAERALRPLRLLERACWDAATAQGPPPGASPAAIGFAGLRWHQLLVDRLAGLRPGENVLPAGDFEDLGSAVAAGWQHVLRPCEGVRSTAELTPTARAAGRFGMRLCVVPADPKNVPTVVESAPVWIISPSVAVEAGQLLCIQASVLVPRGLVGGHDGLWIADSLGGEPLALRVRHAPAWQQVVAYRVAPVAGTMNVSFALCGIGEAMIDEVKVLPLVPRR